MGEYFYSIRGLDSEFAFSYLLQEYLLSYLLYLRSSRMYFLYMTGESLWIKKYMNS